MCVDDVHPVLRLYDRFVLGCARFFDRRLALEDVRLMSVCFFFCDDVLMRDTASATDERLRKSLLSCTALSGYPRFVSCLTFLTFLILCPISAQPSASKADTPSSNRSKHLATQCEGASSATQTKEGGSDGL